MALTFDITYEFPEYKVGQGDTLDLTMIFPNGDANDTIQAHDVGLRVLEWGTIEWSFRVDDRLLVPSELNMAIVDPRNEIYFKFFPNTSAIQTEDLQREAQIRVSINGTVNFDGDVIAETLTADPMDVDKSGHVIRFSAAPRTSILNNTPVYADDDEANDGTLGDDMGYGNNVNYFLVTRYLDDMYTLMGETLSYPNNISIKHDWTFKGVKLTGGGAQNEDFALDEIKLRTGPIFYDHDNKANIATAADVLRSLALGFGSFTGVIHRSQMFFHQLFWYDNSDVQQLRRVGQGPRATYPFDRIQYVKMRQSTDFDSISDNSPWTRGDLTRFPDNLMDEYIPFYFHDDGGAALPVSTVRADGIVNPGSEYEIQHLTWTAFVAGDQELLDFLCQYYLRFRRFDETVPPFRVDEFRDVEGLDYDFLKGFPYPDTAESYKYQIIRMAKHLARGVTDIDAINLGQDPMS